MTTVAPYLSSHPRSALLLAIAPVAALCIRPLLCGVLYLLAL